MQFTCAKLKIAHEMAYIPTRNCFDAWEVMARDETTIWKQKSKIK